MPATRVLVVDDDPLVRTGLRMLLSGDNLVVVGEAADGAAAAEQVDELCPDVVLMDIRMPGIDGLSATESIRRLHNPPEIIILTTFDADEHVLRALRAGAAGFLLKDTPPAEIIAAIHRVGAGDAQLSPSVLRQVIAVATDAPRHDDVARKRLAVLTARELDIAHAIGEGLTNAEIADRLYLSVPTIKGYVSAILNKLDTSNRIQVALLVHDAARD